MKCKRLHRACPVSGSEAGAVQTHGGTVNGQASRGFSRATANAKVHNGMLSPSQAQICEDIEGLDRAVVGEAGDMLTAMGLPRGESNRCKDGSKTLWSYVCHGFGGGEDAASLRLRHTKNLSKGLSK